MQSLKGQIAILAGSEKVKNNSINYFDKRIIKFLSILSKTILSNKLANEHTDLISFAFWIREKNINKIRASYINEEIRLGHGLAFHIAPSNVALNFAYSFVLGLLAGNSNIVRVSKTKFEQNKIFFSIMNKLLKEKRFNFIKKNNSFIKYDQNDEITNFLSKKADCRIVWGSDKTIQNLKKMETQPLCKDIFFPDRYSISILNLEKIKLLNKNSIQLLARKFYLDTFLYDQNACTSPHCVIWLGNKNKNIQIHFWKELNLQIKNEKLFITNEKKMFDKLSGICELSSTRKEIIKNSKIGFINLSQLKKIPSDIDKFRVGNGFFFEMSLKNFKRLNLNSNKKIQTITYFGFNKTEIKDFVKSQKLTNADRIIPVGRAAEFSNIWDGYDLIRSLSKITYVQ